MRIERRDYSSKPWRLLTSDDREVYASENFAHPDLGPTTISMPVCGATRRECETKALALLERAMLLLNERRNDQ